MIKTQNDVRLKIYPKELVYQLKSYEKIHIDLFDNSNDASLYLAQIIKKAILMKQEKNEHIVLGLATGSSPIKLYEELVRMHEQEELSFKNVYTFNLDEYYGLKPAEQQSYHYFMQEYLFKHLDIPSKNIHIPSGKLGLNEIDAYCQNYEQAIDNLGGIDIQILGIGRTGHIGFNEPGSQKSSNTRLVRLDNITRQDAAEEFNGIENVPYKAITMGVNSILKAKEIYIMAWGQHKSDVVKEAIEGEINQEITASFLQEHLNTRFFLDIAAAQKLTRVQHPWKVGNCEWTDDLICRAVIWLSQKTGKPILKLTDKDYSEFGLSELLFKVNNAYQINIKIFNRLQHTITGWPGGKPNTADKNRPERAKPAKKSVLIFSPHPDDDVISMGGTILRLVEQGHEVHVAYQTSGNIAVHNRDALRYIEFFEAYYTSLIGKKLNSKNLKTYKNFLLDETIDKNTVEIRQVKGLIRKGEARTAARFCGIDEANIHFLDLPFYETGQIKKKDMTQDDITITKRLIEQISPHQIFAAGDLSDPHKTHRVCLDIILKSLKEIDLPKFKKQCWLWLYRGAWEEYGVEEIEMAVPLSPDELLYKRKAIFMHKSQKDSAMYPGKDRREFWQRAEDRNRHTAAQYRALGFAEYEAMEAFKRWKY